MNYISEKEEEEGEEGEKNLPLICFSSHGNKYSSIISGIKVSPVDEE